MNLNSSAKSASDGIPLHGPDAFAGMRRAGALAAATLDMITPHVEPGVTTGHLNSLCEAFIRDNGAVPAPLGYHGYPKATCISLNEIICHGIPSDDQRLKHGDVLNIDVTVILDGWHGDTSRMYVAGDFAKLPTRVQTLINVTYDCLMAGIAAVRPGAYLGDIGGAITPLAHGAGFSVVDTFCGHGIGQKFHEPPQVMHDAKAGTGPVLKSGMIFTIEPMINMGRKEGVEVKTDSRHYPNNTIWPARTIDRKASAQFEHTIGITDTGTEIFTLSPAGFTRPPYSA